MGHISQADDGAVYRLDHKVAEFVGRMQTRRRGEVDGYHLSLGPAQSGYKIVGRKSVAYIRGGHTMRGHFFRIKPGSQGELLLAEDLRCLHTFHSLHFGLHYPDQVVGNIRCGQIFAIETDYHGTDILTCGDTYHRLLRSLRQLIEHSVDLGVYLGKRFVGIIVQAHVCGYCAYALRT